MTTTTIKSIGGCRLTVRPSITGDAHVALECYGNDGLRTHGDRVYDRAELAAALGAVATGTPYAEVVEQLHAATQRAEAAEAKLAEKATRLEIESQNAERWYRDCKDAEATIQRVRDALPLMPPGVARSIRAILDPVPPFTLPTTVPATIEAMKTSTLSTMTLVLCTDGSTIWWADPDDWGPFWTPEQVMRDFTGHRLLGAEDA